MWYGEKGSSRDSSSKEIASLGQNTNILSVLLKKEYPWISDTWRQQIQDAFAKIDTTKTSKKELEQFFRQAKNTTKGLPQSLVATALIQYGQNANTPWEKLSIATFKTHVDDIVAQHKRLQNLSKVLQTNKDISADFQNFKKAHPKNYGSLKDIQQSKWFTFDTYVAFQYLTSKQFQQNKGAIVASLSSSDRQVFDAYVQADRRIAQIIVVESTASLLARENQEAINTDLSKEKIRKGTFDTMATRFAADFDAPTGPGKNIDAMFAQDATLYGAQWLTTDQKNEIYTSMSKLTPERIAQIFAEHSQLLPVGITIQDMVTYYINPESMDVTKKEACVLCFNNYLQETFVRDTKNTMKYDVMKEYFGGYVADFLAAWGEVVTMDTTADAIVYNTDGSVDMKYHTIAWVEGSVHIDIDGGVTITDLFAQHGDDDATDNPLIMQKRQRRMDGMMPSMKEMLKNTTTHTAEYIAQFTSSLENKTPYSDVLTNKTQSNKRQQTFVTASMQTSYDVLKSSISHTLNMTQYGNSITQQLLNIQNINWVTANDGLLSYMRWEKPFLDRNTDKDALPIFVMRDVLQSASTDAVKKCTQAMEIISSTYAQLPKEQQLFVFDNDNAQTPVDTNWKISLYTFLESFCTGENMFDIEWFSKVADHIAKNKPMTFSTLRIDAATYFPDKSLFTQNYPATVDSRNEQAVIGKEFVLEEEKLIANTRNALGDLELDVKLGWVL